jgi:ribosome-binding protein aMBF1 (putative translation factor)
VLFSRLPEFLQKMFAGKPAWREQIGFWNLQRAIEDWEAFHPEEARAYQHLAGSPPGGRGKRRGDPDVDRLLRRLGQAIRIERAAARVSIDQVATRAGWSRSTISQIERGDRAPRFDQLLAISQAMGISVFRLLEWADDRECRLCEHSRTYHVLVCSSTGIVPAFPLGSFLPAREGDEREE